MVIITVEETPFRIHKKLICFPSSFFATAFEGPFIEGQTQTIEIRETTKSAFGLFMQWIYSSQISDPNEPENEPENILHRLCELAILADRFLMPELQNATLRKICETNLRTGTSNLSTAHRVYEETLPSNPLRQLLVFVFARCTRLDGLAEHFRERGGNLNRDFLFDIIIELRKTTQAVGLQDINIKKYMVEVSEASGEKASGRKAI